MFKKEWEVVSYMHTIRTTTCQSPAPKSANLQVCMLQRAAAHHHACSNQCLLPNWQPSHVSASKLLAPLMTSTLPSSPCLHLGQEPPPPCICLVELLSPSYPPTLESYGGSDSLYCCCYLQHCLLQPPDLHFLPLPLSSISHPHFKVQINFEN